MTPRKAMIESDTSLSVRRQRQLLAVNRNRLAPQPAKFTDEDAALCRLIDEIHLEDPACGARKIRDVLRRHHRWKLSNTLDTACRLEAFQDAVRTAGRAPAIFNTDQGCQFTSRARRECLESHGGRLSMDGKGRWGDNVFIERLWRSLTYEEVYLRDYRDLHDLERSLKRWFER